MAEKSLWTYLKQGMRPYGWHARRHEDLIGTGIADVSYYLEGNSWIELKEVKRVPTRPSTGIGLGQWHENLGAQRHFLIKRRGWLFVRVNAPGRKYLLFRHDHLPPWDSKWTWDEFRSNAYYIWRNSVDFETLATLLSKPE